VSGFGLFMLILAAGSAVVAAAEGSWRLCVLQLGLTAWIATDLYNDWRAARPGGSD
jgi:hypothetical protein